MKYCTDCGTILLPAIDTCQRCGEPAPHTVPVNVTGSADSSTDYAYTTAKDADDSDTSRENDDNPYPGELPYVERQTPYIEPIRSYPGQLITSGLYATPSRNGASQTPEMSGIDYIRFMGIAAAAIIISLTVVLLLTSLIMTILHIIITLSAQQTTP